MLLNLSIAFCLLALTVGIHVIGLTAMMQRLGLSGTPQTAGFISRIWLLVRAAGWVVAIHGLEIAVWALFYWWQNCLPDFESSLYFSVVTYTTVGYGDLVLPTGWRILAGAEALTGILMCGWSTGFFFTIAARIYPTHTEGQSR